MMRSSFIKTAVPSYWKQLNLLINNEKLINWEDLGLLLLPIRISSSAPLYLLFVLYSVHYVSRLVSGLVSYAFLNSSLTFACLLYCVSRLVSDLVSCASLILSFALCLMHCISCLISRPLGFRSRSSAVDLLVLWLYIVSIDKQLYIELAVNKYRCLVWRRQVSCALRLCHMSCALRLLRFSTRLLPYLLSGFLSRCGAVDLLGFLSTL